MNIIRNNGRNPMVISKKFRYALRSIVEMGALYISNGDPVRLSIISKNQGISFQFLENIFHSFVKAGLLKSVKGRSGGFLPAKPLNQITVLDLMDLINDPFASIDRIKIHEDCSPGKSCTITRFWQSLAEDVRKKLAAISVDKLSRNCLRERSSQLKKKYSASSRK
jgi:Rrf2 family protein